MHQSSTPNKRHDTKQSSVSRAAFHTMHAQTSKCLHFRQNLDTVQGINNVQFLKRLVSDGQQHIASDVAENERRDQCRHANRVHPHHHMHTAPLHHIACNTHSPTNVDAAVTPGRGVMVISPIATSTRVASAAPHHHTNDMPSSTTTHLPCRPWPPPPVHVCGSNRLQ